MKIHGLSHYAQVHTNISPVLNRLQAPYVEAHRVYDQTHGAYAQAHALQCLELADNLFGYNTLQDSVTKNASAIWNGLWFG